MWTVFAFAQLSERLLHNGMLREQGLLQIRQQVVPAFQPDRQAEEIVGRWGARGLDRLVQWCSGAMGP